MFFFWPLAEEFIGATIVLLSIATITSIFIVNFHHQGESGRKPPDWVRKVVFLVFAKLLFVTIPEEIKVSQQSNILLF